MTTFLRAAGIAFALLLGCGALAWILDYAISMSDAGNKLGGFLLLAAVLSVVVGACSVFASFVTKKVIP